MYMAGRDDCWHVPINMEGADANAIEEALDQDSPKEALMKILRRTAEMLHNYG